MSKLRDNSMGQIKGSDGEKIINLNRFRAQALQAVMGSRSFLGRLFGTTHGGKRDLYDVFGWDRAISPENMWEMYSRGGIARRIVHAYPDAVWGSPPTFESTKAWEDAWNVLVEDHKLWSIMQRLDKLTQLGSYAILLIGTDDGGDLSRPIRPGKSRKILYLQPYSERSAKVSKWGDDPSKETFNMPTEYQINPTQAMIDQSTLGGAQSIPTGLKTFRVHHSRVLHVTQAQLESEVVGVPLLWSVWNYLTDLQKVTGGSAESYWLTANRGMHIDLDKEVEMDDTDEALLSEEVDEYINGLRRVIRTRGVKVENLGTDVADPKGPFETLVTLIAGATGIPKRILLGSESGHNASTQDKGNWSDHIEHYRTLTANPSFIDPLIKQLTQMGILPTVVKTKTPKPLWPDTYKQSPLERAQTMNQRATALNSLGLAMKSMPNLLGRQEVRKFGDFEEDGKGDELEIVQSGSTQKDGDGGLDTAGPNSGVTGTPLSDSDGKGNPTQSTMT